MDSSGQVYVSLKNLVYEVGKPLKYGNFLLGRRIEVILFTLHIFSRTRWYRWLIYVKMFIYLIMVICGRSDRVAVYPIALTVLCDNVYLLDNGFLRSIRSRSGLSDQVDGFKWQYLFTRQWLIAVYPIALRSIRSRWWFLVAIFMYVTIFICGLSDRVAIYPIALRSIRSRWRINLITAICMTVFICAW